MPQHSDTTLPSHEGLRGDAAVVSWAITILHAPVRELVDRRIELGASLRLGRGGGGATDVEIDDGKLSREHAVITRAGVVVEIRDRASRNGTFVNGARIDACTLRPGDIVRIGDTLLELGDTPARDGSNDPLLVGTAPAFLAAVDLANKVAP